MTTPAYLTSLLEAVTKCQMAQAEAEAVLPEAIKQEYLLLRTHNLSGWNALMERHPHLRAIEALEIASEFTLRVTGLQLRVDGDHRPIDLTLGKTRPSFAGHGRHKGKES